MNSLEGNMREKLVALESAAKKAAKLHAIDADLVRPGAKEHGVKVVEGDLFKSMEKHCYNPRIPNGTGKEAQKLSKVRRLLGVCEDYRQSYEVVHDSVLAIDQKKDAVFATAGGDAQPDTERFNGDVDFYCAVIDANPDVEIILTHHVGVCGGANHYTGGHMKEVHNDPSRGIAQEAREMNEFGTKMYNAILERKPSAHLSMWMVNVGEKNEYLGLTNLR